MKETSNQTVMIGGITGGIGSNLARTLLERGYRVGGFARSGERFEALRAEQDALSLFEADACDAAAVNGVMAEAAEALGGIDAYVHAVGSVFLKPTHLMTDEEWHAVLATNLHSAFYAGRAAVNQMRRRKSGRILFLSSVAARIGISNHEAIAAAKAGVAGLTQSMAATYASLNLRVNALALGLVETEATQAIVGSPQAREISERMHPVGSIGTPDSVASLLAWLLSPEADWVTGQIWGFDGGMAAVLPKPRA